jgi:hypothetical protein
VLILRKQRQQITGVAVSATSERDDNPPWKFKRIRIVYALTGRNLSAEHVRRAIALSEEKYCAIYATLRDVVGAYERVCAGRGRNGRTQRGTASESGHRLTAASMVRRRRFWNPCDIRHLVDVVVKGEDLIHAQPLRDGQQCTVNV